jgi:hypothetical protein
MAFDETPRTDRRPAHGATLPMKQLPRFTAGDLLFTVRQILAGSQAQVDLDLALTTIEEAPAFARFWNRPKSPPTVGLSVNGITIAVTGHDRPAFSSEDMARLDVGQWLGGRSEIARGRAHVEVSEVCAALSADMDQNHDRAVAVTVVAAAVSRLVETIGLVWHASHCCVPADRLPGLIAGLEQGRAPVSLWLGAALVPAHAGRPASLTTRGLYPLLGAEIEVSECRLPHAVVLDIALALAERIIGVGAPPEHGARLSFGAGRNFLVRHMPRGCGNDVPALILIPESEPAVAGAA